jgi:hypothetical protein
MTFLACAAADHHRGMKPALRCNGLYLVEGGAVSKHRIETGCVKLPMLSMMRTALRP